MFGGNSNWRDPVWFPAIARHPAPGTAPDPGGADHHPASDTLPAGPLVADPDPDPAVRAVLPTRFPASGVQAL